MLIFYFIAKAVLRDHHFPGTGGGPRKELSETDQATINTFEPVAMDGVEAEWTPLHLLMPSKSSTQ